MDTLCGATSFDWFFPLLAAPFVGSFLGVLILRLPARRPLVFARSECDACHRALTARDLVPLLSFLAFRGKCRSCGEKIGKFHPVVELAALAVAAWAIIAEGTNSCAILSIWLDCGLGWTLLALAWIDCGHMRLPDALTLPLLLAGLGATYVTDPESMADHSAAAIAGYAAFRAISWGYARLRGREGLGAGDAKLLAAGGAWLGLAALPYVVLAAAALGIAWVGANAARGRKIAATTAIPFGPCLAASIFLIRLYAGDVEF